MSHKIHIFDANWFTGIAIVWRFGPEVIKRLCSTDLTMLIVISITIKTETLEVIFLHFKIDNQDKFYAH